MHTACRMLSAVTLPGLPKVTAYIIGYRCPGSHPDKLLLLLLLPASASSSIRKPIMLQTKQAEKTISLYEKSLCQCNHIAGPVTKAFTNYVNKPA